MEVDNDFMNTEIVDEKVQTTEETKQKTFEEVTNKYFQQKDFIKFTVKQNYKDVSKLNYDLRWQYDNRISVADRGMLNPECDRYFVINSGVIGQTDAYGPIRVNKYLEQSNEYRNVKYSGKDNWI